jgi:hypothetical protein
LSKRLVLLFEESHLGTAAGISSDPRARRIAQTNACILAETRFYLRSEAYPMRPVIEAVSYPARALKYLFGEIHNGAGDEIGDVGIVTHHPAQSFGVGVHRILLKVWTPMDLAD